MLKEKLSWKQALLWIFAITLLISGTSTLIWLFYLSDWNRRSHDDHYLIKAIVQTGPEKEALKTVYLAEILDLSVDKSKNLYAFNAKDAEHKLLKSPLIKKAVVEKLLPETLYIEYSARKPLAFLGDFSNTAIDEEGYLFPFHPFFTPKKLPEIFLGITSLIQNGEEENIPAARWGAPITGKHATLAFEVLKTLGSKCCSGISHVRRIDVSKAYTESYGQRQIVVIMEDVWERDYEGKSILCVVPRILRLSTQGYAAELEEYLVLREYLLNQELQQAIDQSQTIVKLPPMMIDMRIPNLAFVKE